MSTKTPKEGPGKKPGFFKECPLAFLIILSLLAVSVLGFLFTRKQAPLAKSDLISGKETYISVAMSNQLDFSNLKPQIIDAFNSIIRHRPAAPKDPDAKAPSAKHPDDSPAKIAEAASEQSKEKPASPPPHDMSDSKGEPPGKPAEKSTQDPAGMSTDGPQKTDSEPVEEKPTGADGKSSSKESPKDDAEGHVGIEVIYDPLSTEPRQPADPRSGYYDDPQVTAHTTPADYRTVEDNYFDDALFIGDSRIDGLAIYGIIPNAKFLSMQGVHLYTIYNAAMTYRSGAYVISWSEHLLNVLKNNEYGKIYIQIGINDMSAYDSDDYQESMQELIDTIREYQPNAIIFLTSIMNLSTDCPDESSSLNNDAINSRNYRLALLADGKTVFYLDENTVFNDETGGLDPAYTFDGIHLTPERYDDWKAFLMEHGI